VDGPNSGIQKRFGGGDISSELWGKMEARDIVEGRFEDASKKVKKNTANRFLRKWCAAIASNDGDTFEEEWGLLKGSGVEEEELADVADGADVD